MAATQNRDMGSGSIPKLLAQLALPAVVAQVVNLLYNIVDRIYIGHMPEVGASALTGVGLFTPILMLITAFAMLCGSGGAPRAAIAMGRGDDDAAEKIMGNCFTLLLILAAVLTVVFYFAAPSLLVLFGASEKTLPYALDYARIYIIGTIFVLIVMGMNSQFPSSDSSVRSAVSLSSLTEVYCARSSLRFFSFSCVVSAMRYSSTLTPLRASSANGVTVRSSNSVSIHPPPSATSPVGARLLFLSSKSM